MVDAINAGARQIAEKMVNEASQDAGNGQTGSAAGNAAGGPTDSDAQNRFAQAMSGPEKSGSADGAGAVNATTDAPMVGPINRASSVPPPGESILAGIDKMRSGLAESAAGMAKAASAGKLSPQELAQVQMHTVQFTTTETLYSKTAGTAKSDLDKLLNS